jgi:nicotinate-nucleotide pyrophosphorylase (carboxylating)
VGISLPKRILEEMFRRFVEEDIGHGDITTLHTIPPGTVVEAEIVAKEKGVIAGIEEALMFLESFGLQAEALGEDGSKVGERTKLVKVEGDSATLLSVERTLLNLLSRMSGIATSTNRLVEKIHRAGYETRVACTRKTAPGLAYFDKKAVIIGGGDAHRWGLDDMVLIKDNHIAITGSVKETVKRVRKKVSFSKKVEIEAKNVNEAMEAARTGVDIIMLDNFTPKQAKDAINLLRKKGFRDKVLVEASGGITEQNILEYAESGVDIVSLGEITHSARALDMSLEITSVRKRQS